jgi:hypothetical protein
LPAKNKKINLLDILTKRDGYYMGTGVNHENKEFQGTLTLRSIVNKKGVSLKYKAIGIEGNEFNKDTTLYNHETILYNEEYTLICYDSENKLTLWTLNNNIGTMARFDLRRFRQVSTKHCLFIFGFGDPEDNNIFREEITIELWEDGDIGYNYSWGEAGGHFLSRSTIRMKKTS